jgi:hypothetical protein
MLQSCDDTAKGSFVWTKEDISMGNRFVIGLAIAASWTVSARATADAPLAEKYLVEGRLAAGEAALMGAVQANPDDAQARFGLGTVQFLRAVERIVQSLHRHGMKTDQFGGMLPFARLPIPAQEKPEPIRYADLRAIFQAWNDDLGKAEATLAKIDDKQVKLPLHFGQFRLDFDGDGQADADETLWKIYARLNGAARGQATAEGSKDFLVTFDRGDVAWLRGYCHLLMGFGEVYLAHDGKELFDHTASLFFPRAETPFPFLRRAPGQAPQGFDIGEALDAVAFIHLLRLPVAEPKRLGAVLGHLEAMIALSRESWQFILAETDDDHEWVPNPKQHTVMPGGAVTDEMVKGWMSFLDEAQSLLKGEKLVPFWRHEERRGVNLRRVFTEPRTLDLVLWAQGTAAAPYLQEGELTSLETWRRFQRIFRGEFIGFALWFN